MRTKDKCKTTPSRESFLSKWEKIIKEVPLTKRDDHQKPEIDFHISIFWSVEDNCYFAVPSWHPHNLSAFGDTPEDALRELCTVLQMVIESGAKLADAPIGGEGGKDGT